MTFQKPPMDYVRTKGDEALARLRECAGDLELLEHRVGRLEIAAWLLLVGYVLLAFFFLLHLWISMG